LLIAAVKEKSGRSLDTVYKQRGASRGQRISRFDMLVHEDFDYQGGDVAKPDAAF